MASRFSVLISDELFRSNEDQESEKRFDVRNRLDLLNNRACTILEHLIGSKEFQLTYLCNNGADELHVITHSSKRIIVVDALARCPVDQVANFDTYKFSSHPKLEKRISAYTRCSDKPNPQLAKFRSWDIALTIIIKVEALDKEVAKLHNSRLLFREYAILKHIWDSYLKESMELDDMSGIPMVFEYAEVPNADFNYEPKIEYRAIDTFGSLMQLKPTDPTTLSYMSMEKMGPSIKFFQDIMRYTKRKTPTFDIETSFKVFDQLICRCLQIHRFGVINNSVEPKNIYFGRSMAFNVLYLGNYSKSFIVDSKERKIAEVSLSGDPRFASHVKLYGMAAHPVQDIESAFYTLLSMLVTHLPWDMQQQQQQQQQARLRGMSENLNFSNAADTLVETSDEMELYPKMREMKVSFWKSPVAITRLITALHYLAVDKDTVNISLAQEIIKELYSKLREQIMQLTARPKLISTGSLMSLQNSEVQFYIDLRRCVLMFFRFDSISLTISTPSYQKKIEAISREDQEPRPAWDISNWCFNAVQMNAPGNMRLSMMTPIDAVARTSS